MKWMAENISNYIVSIQMKLNPFNIFLDCIYILLSKFSVLTFTFPMGTISMISQI